jgi:predicted PurR-regulated permease PerM
MAQERGLSYTLRVVIGLAAAGLTLFFMNMAAEFIVQILLTWIIVLSASPLFYWLQKNGTPGC